jgi:hypothetical protein
MPFSMNAITVSNDQRTIQSHHSYGIRMFRQLPLGTKSFESISCQAYGWTAHEAGKEGVRAYCFGRGQAMTFRLLGEDLDSSEAQFAFDRLLKEYFARLPEIDAQATSYDGCSCDLASDQGNASAASTDAALRSAGIDDCVKPR